MADEPTIRTQLDVHQVDIQRDASLERDVAFFLRWGCLVVDHALSMEQVDAPRGALDAGYSRHRSEEFINQLLEEDDRFGFIPDNPPVFKRMQALLGSCVQLHSPTGRLTDPGTSDQN